MTNIVSTTVTRIDVGGPGLQFSITFTGNYGNIVPLTCDASNLASATCVISTTQDVRDALLWALLYCCVLTTPHTRVRV